MASSPVAASVLNIPMPLAFPDEDRHLAEFREKGYTIIPDAIPIPLLDRILEVIERLEATSVPGNVDASLSRIAGSGTFRETNLLAADSVFHTIAAFEPVLSMVDKVIGPQPLLHAFQTLCVGPGQERQPLHTDDIYMEHPRPHPTFIFNTIWAITDFTEENGGTRIVPFSHHWPDTPRKTAAECSANPLEMQTEYVAMKRGSIVAVDGALWHGAGANVTDHRRAGISIGYCRGWMRQQDNFQQRVGHELARSFSPRLRELCGFGLYQGFIGNIDYQSPAGFFHLGQTGA